MSHRYDHEKYLIGLALDEIEHAIHQFDSNSLGDYLDWEFDVERCIGNFSPYSCRLRAIISKKLIGFTGLWWRFHVMGRMMDGYGDKVSWEDMKRAMREKLVPSYYQDQQFEKLVMLK